MLSWKLSVCTTVIKTELGLTELSMAPIQIDCCIDLKSSISIYPDNSAEIVLCVNDIYMIVEIDGVKLL